MKKFSFRLEKLLGLKERMEVLKRGEYGAALQEVSDRERALNSLEDERRHHCEAEQEHLTGDGINVEMLRAYSRYFHRLRGKKLMTTEIKRSLEKKAESKRLELVESSREKKTLEQFKEKLQLRHLQEMDKVGQKELDELGAVQFIRKANLPDSR
jgi:flagellar protein FliJ